MKKGRTVLQAKRYGVVTCPPTCTLLEAARHLVQEDISALVIVDDAGALLGLLSRSDILRAHLALEDWHTAQVGDHMSRKVVTVETGDLLSTVAEHLVKHHIHRVVVVRPDEHDRPHPVGVVSAADLMYHLVKDYEG